MTNTMHKMDSDRYKPEKTVQTADSAIDTTGEQDTYNVAKHIFFYDIYK